MTNIKTTYTFTFTVTSPFNEATYPNQTLEDAVKLEENIDIDDVLDIISEGSYKNDKLEVNVEILD